MDIGKVIIPAIIILPILVLSIAPQKQATESVVLWSAMSYNWDGVPGSDGIEISVRPQDSDGELTQIPAMLYVSLLSSSGEVIQSWEVVLPETNYTEMYSTPIRLEYSNPHLPCEFGTVSIRLTYFSKTFTDVLEDVPLGAN
jgi:hypothetical protein